MQEHDPFFGLFPKTPYTKKDRQVVHETKKIPGVADEPATERSVSGGRIVEAVVSKCRAPLRAWAGVDVSRRSEVSETDVRIIRDDINKKKRYYFT